MQITSAPPQFGVNYDTGWVGWTFAGDFVADAIAYFERFNHLPGDCMVAHTFIVSGPDTCIEAHIESGVAEAPLSKYFDNPNVKVFFREPADWTPGLGASIAATARTRIGDRYATALIVADALANTFLGRIVNYLLNDWPNYFLCWLLSRPHREICSMLVSFALAMQPELRGRGILKQPTNTINPQQLFEDQLAFESGAFLVKS